MGEGEHGRMGGSKLNVQSPTSSGVNSSEFILHRSFYNPDWGLERAKEDRKFRVQSLEFEV